MSNWDVLGALVRIVLGLVLMIAGFAKLQTRTWGVLAREAGVPRLVVLTLPAIECTLGLALIAQVWIPVVSVLTLLLFLGFLVVIWNQYRSPSELPCNCFGSRPSALPVNKWTVARNIALVLLAIVGVLLR